VVFKTATIAPVFSGLFVKRLAFGFVLAATVSRP